MFSKIESPVCHIQSSVKDRLQVRKTGVNWYVFFNFLMELRNLIFSILLRSINYSTTLSLQDFIILPFRFIFCTNMWNNFCTIELINLFWWPKSLRTFPTWSLHVGIEPTCKSFIFHKKKINLQKNINYFNYFWRIKKIWNSILISFIRMIISHLLKFE